MSEDHKRMTDSDGRPNRQFYIRRVNFTKVQSLVGIDFTFVNLLVWAFSIFVVVVEAAILALKLLHVSVVRPAIYLHNSKGSLNIACKKN